MPVLRSLVQESYVSVTDLVQPLFITEKEGLHVISSMPDMFRFGPQALLKECESLLQVGIKAIGLFPNIDPALKNPEGTEALNPDNIVAKAITLLKKNFPELLIIADIALDPYTSHGHDGVLDSTQREIDNDKSISLLAKQACLLAGVGADIVAPSDMLDGTVLSIRNALDANNLAYTPILAYSAKFYSSFYGPFRDAVGSSTSAGTAFLNKASYQIHPANAKEALRKTRLDEANGADMLMVKPAGLYLDIIQSVKKETCLPVVAYQVSGEYAQIHAAAQNGWLDLDRCMEESLISIKRSGADLIYTYFAKKMAQILKAM